MAKVTIEIDKGFIKTEIPKDISIHHLECVKREIDKTLQERLEKPYTVKKMSKSKKTIRFIKRLFKSTHKSVKSAFNKPPKYQHCTVENPLLIEMRCKKC